MDDKNNVISLLDDLKNLKYQLDKLIYGTIEIRKK